MYSKWRHSLAYYRSQNLEFFLIYNLMYNFLIYDLILIRFTADCI